MTNPRELVERLRLHGQDSVGRFYECDQAAQALSAALDREERLEADNTRLRGLLEEARTGLSEFPNISGDPKVEALASSLLKRLEEGHE